MSSRGSGFANALETQPRDQHASGLQLQTGCPPEHEPQLDELRARHPEAHPGALHRFLKAQGYDVAKASAMWTAHLAWRAATLLPLTARQNAMVAAARPGPEQAAKGAPESAAAAHSSSDSCAAGGEVQPEPRSFYRLAARDGEGHVVLCCVLRHWVGLGPAELDEALGAYLGFIEETAALVDQATEPGLRRWTLIIDCAGLGPTSVPMTFLRRINAVFEPNYPERLRQSVMVPIPSVVVRFVDPMLRMMLQPEIRAKFGLVSTSAALADSLGMRQLADLPPELAGF